MEAAQSQVAKRSVAFRLTAMGCIALLAWGWSVRREALVSAAFGPGYALGIAGTAMMTLLLLYSLRKRLRFMRTWGPIRYWFRIHMLLGLLGPVAVLFHANFQLGSLNSNVALACVLLVAASGIVGRLVYPKVHQGLSGRRLTLRELHQSAESQRGALGAALSGSPPLARELAGFEVFALGDGASVGSPARLVSIAPAALRTRSRCRRLLAQSGSHSQAMEEAVLGYVEAVRRVAEFRGYARIFSLWHAFHLPLCFLLFTAAAIHVIAVHAY